MTEKPSLNEVLDYGEEQISYYLRKLASESPEEHREEMAQNARARIVRAYERVAADKGWRTFIQRHVYGSIQDYLRKGTGFQETNWSLQEERDGETPIRFRETGPADTVDGDIETVLNLHGVSNENEADHDGELAVRWNLLVRLCSIDQDLEIFVRHTLMRQSLTDLVIRFNVTRERLGQRVDDFVNRFYDRKQARSRWFLQIIYALDLCEQLGLPDVDQGCGWNLEPLDLAIVEHSNFKKLTQSVFDLH